MSEPFDFPRELRCDSVMLGKSHPYTADMLGRAATEIERLQRNAPTPSASCTCLCCRADKMNLLVRALEDVATARMPGQARVIAAKALRAVRPQSKPQEGGK